MTKRLTGRRYGNDASLAVVANFPSGVAATLTLPARTEAIHD